MNFTPSDNKEMFEKHLTDNGGCCGQACLAVIQRISIADVFVRWHEKGLVWKGWSGWKQLRQYLESSGYKVKQITKKNKTKMKSDFYILRIQWLGKGERQSKPFFGYNHWSIASAQTHFIVLEKDMFFCNASGWFSNLDGYLASEPRGVVTSIFEVTKIC